MFGGQEHDGWWSTVVQTALGPHAVEAHGSAQALLLVSPAVTHARLSEQSALVWHWLGAAHPGAE